MRKAFVSSFFSFVGLLRAFLSIFSDKKAEHVLFLWVEKDSIMKLYNKVDRRVLRAQLERDTEKRTTLSFYKYAKIGNPQLFRDHLFIEWDKIEVFGRVYVAQEGINAQISVPDKHFDAFEEQLETITFLQGVRLNIAREDDGKSFYKLKIKVKEKIVADGLNDDEFDVTDGGQHLDAATFNELTDQDNTILVDMRNHYESEVGHFEGAITPDVDTFREELPVVEDILKGQEDKNIVMYCTGGIRCEKASAYFKHKGFKNVFQLDGGIIEYARQVEEQGLPNKFKGKNFVFDDRLGERITEEIISQCHQCGALCDTHVNCANVACNLLFIQCEDCKAKTERCCSNECQEIIQLSEEEQKELRQNTEQKKRYFKKGRSEKLIFKK